MISRNKMTIIKTIKQIAHSRYTMPFLLLMCFISPFVKCINTLRGGGGIHSPYYFIGYETGFGGRKLIGTLLSPFLPEYVQHRHIVPIILIAFIVLSIAFIVFVCHTIKIRDLKTTLAAQSVFAFIAVYLISDFSIFGFIGRCAGYIDIFLYLTTFAFLFIYIKYRTKWFYYIGVALIVLSGCLIHHIFCCLFFPLFLALFIYDIYADNIFNAHKFLAYSIISTLLLLLFLLIWFFSSPMDIDAVYEQVCNRTNGVCIKERLVFQWLYGTNHENYLSMWEIEQFPLRYYQFFPVLLLISPLLGLFCAPWIMSIRKAQKGPQRVKYLLMFLVQILVFFPIFIIATDYSRWWYAWFFCQTMMILTMYKIHDVFFINQLQDITVWLKRNWIIASLLLIYLCSFTVGVCGVDWIDIAFSLR